MDESERRIARRIGFLRAELARLGDDAGDAEDEMRYNPTDEGAKRRLSAIYERAREMWRLIEDLEAGLETHRTPTRIKPIVFDHPALRSSA